MLAGPLYSDAKTWGLKMVSRTIAGLEFTARSPSHYEYNGAGIFFDGIAWIVGVDGKWGTKEFPTLLSAAELIATAFTSARENLG